MSKTYTTLSREGYTYLCSIIKQVVSLPTDVIDNLNLATNTTYSSIKIKTIVDKTLEDAKEYANEVCAALVKLECRKTTTQPTLDNSDINVIYLYSADGNAPFQQYLKISETELVYMGSTNINLDGYLTATEITRDYVTKLDFDSLKTEVDKKLNKTDIIDNLTSTDTDKPLSANQGKILDDKKLNKADISTIIDSSSTNDKVPSEKAVFDAIHEPILMTLSSTSDITALLTKLRSLAPGTNATIKLYDNSGVLFPVTGNYIGTVSVINANEITVICVNHWYSQHAYTFKVQNDDTSISLNKICTTKVADVPVTNIAPADTATFVNFAGNPNCNYRVRNGVCYVTFEAIRIASAGGFRTGVFLPKSSSYQAGGFLTGAGDATPHAYVFVLEGTGEIGFDVKDANTALYGSFSYPVAES